MTAFAGFDRSDYPGKAAMDWLKANTNFKWTGFYLGPAPSHPNTSWMDADDADFEGWGFAPIYVGRQITGPGARLADGLGQGAADGKQACELMVEAGFAAGNVVFLDLENGPPMPTIQREYVGAWCDAVTAAGFVPGVYCSFLFAAQVHALRPAAKIWVYHVRTVSPHPVAGTVMPNPDPATSGYPGASVWQHDDEARVHCPPIGVLACDLNSASSADPSVA